MKFKPVFFVVQIGVQCKIMKIYTTKLCQKYLNCIRKSILLNKTNFVIDKLYFDHSTMRNTVAQFLYILVQFS